MHPGPWHARSRAQFVPVGGGDLRLPRSFPPPCGLDLDELGVGMGDNGGEHDAADDERPGGVPINPKHVSSLRFAGLRLPASVVASSACEIGVTAAAHCRSLAIPWRACGSSKSRQSLALSSIGRRDLAIGLIRFASVALCHDVFIVPAFARTRRRLGLAGLAAMLAAHIGLTFEVVFAGHTGSMQRAGNGS